MSKEMKTEQRVIKFRGQRIGGKDFVYGSLDITASGLYYIRSHSIQAGGFGAYLATQVEPSTVGPCTGLVDKEGNEIYADDILRIKGRMGNQKEYGYDALYKVMLSTYEGLSLRFLKLTNQEPDNHENSYPISISMGFSDKRLSTDYRNDQYNRLAVADHFYDDSSRKRNQDHHYTNDIQVVGNVFQNIDLLPSTTTI